MKAFVQNDSPSESPRGIARTFRMTAPQREFCVSILKGKARYNAFVGGVGSGKTYAGCVAAINLSLAFAGNRGVIASGTERQLTDTVERQFFEILEAYRLDGQVVERSKSERRVLFHNGSEILFRSMEAFPRLLSLNLGWFYVDEASTVSVEGFKVLMSRLRLGGPRPRVGYVTSNPDNGWLREVFDEKKWTDDVFMVRAETESNRFLPEGYAEDLRKAFSGAYARRYLDGQFVELEGRVYGMFNPDTHLVENFVPPENWKRYRAIDFGYVNPFVCLFFAEAPDGRVVVYDEYVASRRLIEEHVRAIAKKSGENRFEATYADHDAQGRAELEALGLRVQPARKEVLDGIADTVRALGREIEGERALRIDKRCRTTLSEIENYRWDRSVGGRETPLKRDDHCMDALRYGIRTRLRARAASGPALLTQPRRRTEWNR